MPDPSARHSSDLALAQAAIQGDAAAFRKIFDLYSPPVMAFARRARADEDGARSLAREILEAVFAHLHGYSGRTSLAAWVLAVARLASRPGASRSASAAA